MQFERACKCIMKTTNVPLISSEVEKEMPELLLSSISLANSRLECRACRAKCNLD